MRRIKANHEIKSEEIKIFRVLEKIYTQRLAYIRRGLRIYAAPLRIYAAPLRIYADLRIYAGYLRIYAGHLRIYAAPLRIYAGFCDPRFFPRAYKYMPTLLSPGTRFSRHFYSVSHCL